MHKNLFPIFIHNPDLCFLDNASTTHKPKQVIDAITDSYSLNYSSIGRGDYPLTLKASLAYSDCLEAARNFLNASSIDEILLSRGFTDSINTIVSGLDNFSGLKLEPGDEIILSTFDHNSNVLPWMLLAKKLNLKIKYLSLYDAINKNIGPYITRKSKILTLSQVINVTGTIVPVSRIIRLSKAINPHIVTVVDGVQSVPCMKIDVQEQMCDIFICSSHKFYGPNGSGITYIKKSIQHLLPWVHVGGGTLQDRDNITNFFNSYPQNINIQRKLESGTLNLPNIRGLHEAMNFITPRYSFLHKHYYFLYQYTAFYLKNLGFTVLDIKPKSFSILTAYHNKINAYDLSMMLGNSNICVRSGKFCNHLLFLHEILDTEKSVIRISFAIYNNKNDVESLVRCITKTLDLLS